MSMGPLEHRPKIAHHNIGQRGPTMVAAATSGLWGSTRRDMSLGYNLPPSFRGSSSGFPTPKTWLRRPKRCIASHGAWSSWPSTWPPAMAIEGGQQCHPRIAPWLGTGGLISSLPRSTKQGRWGNTDEAVWYEVPRSIKALKLFTSAGRQSTARLFSLLKRTDFDSRNNTIDGFNTVPTLPAWFQLVPSGRVSPAKKRGKLGGSPTWHLNPTSKTPASGPRGSVLAAFPSHSFPAHMSTHQQPKVRLSFFVPMGTPEPTTIAAAEASNDSGWLRCVFKIRFVRRSEGREEKSGTRAATAMSHRVSTLSQPAFLDAPPWHASTASAAMLHFHFQRCQPPGQRFCSVRIFACYLPVSVTPRFSLRRGYRGRQAARCITCSFLCGRHERQRVDDCKSYHEC